jgi:hypothetical protein
LAVAFTAENLSSGLSHVARLAAHPKFVWFSTPTAMGQSFIITLYKKSKYVLVSVIQFECEKNSCFRTSAINFFKLSISNTGSPGVCSCSFGCFLITTCSSFSSFCSSGSFLIVISTTSSSTSSYP